MRARRAARAEVRTHRLAARAATWLVMALALGGGLALVSFFVAGLSGQGIFPSDQPWAAGAAFFGWAGLGQSVALSLFSGITSSLVALWVCKHCLAAQAVGTGFWARALRGLIAASRPILAVPHVAFAIGLSLLVWPGGWIARLLSPWATGWQRVPDWVIIGDPYAISLTAGLVLREVPFLLVMALSVSRSLPLEAVVRQGRSLGLAGYEAWVRLAWPLVWPRIRLPFVLVLGFGLTNVEMALVLGPNTPPTLAVWVLSLFTDANPARFAQVPWGALGLSVVTAGGILAALAGLEAARRALRRGAWLGRWRGTAKTWARAQQCVAATALASSVLALVGGGLATALFALSRRWRFPDALPQLSLASLRQQAPGLLDTVGQTLILGGTAVFAASALALWCLEHLAARGARALPSGWSWGLYTPLILPQILLVLALYAAALTLGGSAGWGLVFLTHALFCFCYVMLLVGPAWLALDSILVNQARALGMGPMRRLVQIKLPTLIAPWLFALAMALSVSFALYLPPLVLGGGRVATLVTEGVHFSANLRRPQMALFAFAQGGVSLAAFVLSGLVLAWMTGKRRQPGAIKSATP